MNKSDITKEIDRQIGLLDDNARENLEQEAGRELTDDESKILYAVCRLASIGATARIKRGR